VPHTPIEHHRVAGAREHGERAGKIVCCCRRAVDRFARWEPGRTTRFPMPGSETSVRKKAALTDSHGCGEP
jgi:hypothetical protein